MAKTSLVLDGQTVNDIGQRVSDMFRPHSDDMTVYVNTDVIVITIVPAVRDGFVLPTGAASFKVKG